jgi:hypothetical protein
VGNGGSVLLSKNIQVASLWLQDDELDSANRMEAGEKIKYKPSKESYMSRQM